MYQLISTRQNVTRGLSVFAKVIGIPLLGYALVLGYQAWRASQLPPPPIASFGLTESIENEDVNLTGVLYLNTTPPAEEGIAPYTNQYVFAEDTFSNLTDFPSLDYTYSEEGFALLITGVPNANDPDGRQPVEHDVASGQLTAVPYTPGYNEQELTVSSDNHIYAYSFQSEPNLNMFQLENWNVAVYDLHMGEIVVIPKAAEPKFLPVENAVAFIREDGIFKYDMDTKQVTPLYTRYEQLTMIDDFDISADGQWLVLTTPTVHSLSVAQYDEASGKFAEVGVHVDTEYRFRHPVVSPDSRMYAVLAAEEQSYDATLDAHTNAAIEFRLMQSRQLIDQIDLEGIHEYSFEPTRWLTN